MNGAGFNDQLGVQIAYDAVALTTNCAGPAALSVGTTAIEAKVGALRLAGRSGLIVVNNSPNTIYWGLSSAVTTAAGIPIHRDTFAFIPINPASDVEIWFIAGQDGNDVRVIEVKGLV